MNTKSIIHALTGIILPVLLSVAPATGQVKFASQNSFSFSGQNKLFAVSFLNYYASAESDRLRNAGSMPFPSSLPVKDNNIAEEISFTGKRDEPAELSYSKNSFRNNLNFGKISFKPTSFIYPLSSGKDIGIAEYPAEKLVLYATVLKQYAKKNGFDTTYGLFSNMGMLNNKKRFFVINLVTMKVEQSGFVAQGRGHGPSRFDKQYSNKRDSKCTSLGRYKIMKKYRGEYGVAYRMAGLDKSNSNAFKRNIVLHSMGCMPDKEDNMPVCISEGCPAVSVKFLSFLSKVIDSRKKPVLLWIFDSNLEEVLIEQRTSGQATGLAKENIIHKCSIHRPSVVAE